MTRTIKVTNGDWTIDRRTGRPVMIEGKDKLKQDIRECLSIATQPNGYGAGLDDLIGMDADPFSVQSQVQRAVRRSVVALQRLQEQFQLAERSAEERIASVTAIRVQPANIGGQTSKVAFSFRVDVTSVAGTTPVTVSGSVT